MKHLASFPGLINTFFLAFSLFTISSCSKGGNASPAVGGDVFLTCKINGVDHKFNYHVNANDKPSTNIVHFVVIGGWEGEDMMKSPGFSIDMVLPEGAQEKTYTVAGGSTPELDGQYYIQNYVGGQLQGTTVYSGGRSDETNFTLTITSLTKWGVKGTFNGLLRLSGGDELVTVTEGKFSAPYN